MLEISSIGYSLSGQCPLFKFRLEHLAGFLFQFRTQPTELRLHLDNLLSRHVEMILVHSTLNVFHLRFEETLLKFHSKETGRNQHVSTRQHEKSS